MPTLGRVLIVLECGHIVPGAVRRLGESHKCYNCEKFVPLKEVHEFEWKAKCMEPKCRYCRYTGLSKDLAMRIASTHAQLNKHVKVIVTYEKNPTAIKATERLRHWKLV